MFTQKQLDVIEQVGAEGLSLKVAASQVGMVYSKFMEEYNDSEDAQLSFEKGQSSLEIKAVTIANSQMEKGDPKAFEFITDKVLNMSGKNKNENIKVSNKANTIPSALLNPSLLLDFSDEELQRRADQKRDDELSKKPIKIEKEEDSE